MISLFAVTKKGKLWVGGRGRRQIKEKTELKTFSALGKPFLNILCRPKSTKDIKSATDTVDHPAFLNNSTHEVLLVNDICIHIKSCLMK